MAANKVKNVFCRGAYLAENTSQAASVELVPLRGINYARSRLQKFVGKPRRGFRQLGSRSYSSGIFLRRSSRNRSIPARYA